MALIVETGSGVENAVSYIQASAVSAFASARGVSLTLDDPTIEKNIITAMDFFEAYHAEFKGVKAQVVNYLQFPRAGLYLDGYEQPATTIPKIVTDCLCSLTLDAIDGVLYQPRENGRVVKKFKLEGVMEKEYGDTSSPESRMPRSMALLNRLLDGGSFGQFEVGR